VIRLNNKGSGVGAVVASAILMMLQVFILAFFLSAILHFSLEQQLQVEAQKAVHLITRNLPTHQNMVNANSYLMQQLDRFGETGEFNVEYRIVSRESITTVWSSSGDSLNFNGFEPRTGDILQVIIRQEGDSILGRVVSVWTGWEGSIRIAVRKVAAFERK